MNDEYLWNKDGTNEEIERLEVALSTFRGRPDESPFYWQTARPPAVEVGRTRSFSQYLSTLGWRRLPLSVGLAVIVVLSLFWTKAAFDKTSFSVPPVEIAAVEMPGREDSSQEGKIAAVEETPARETRPDRSVKLYRASSRKRSHSPSRRPNVIPVRRADPPEKLSDEERFAYRQLMIALSIAGSKLKIVRDTVNGDGRYGPALR